MEEQDEGKGKRWREKICLKNRTIVGRQLQTILKDR
jgi:hypothetical protein